MYQLFRILSLRELLIQQLPVFAVSIVIAEMYYKFHSFTLECIAFAITWAALDYIATQIKGIG